MPVFRLSNKSFVQLYLYLLALIGVSFTLQINKIYASNTDCVKVLNRIIIEDSLDDLDSVMTCWQNIDFLDSIIHISRNFYEKKDTRHIYLDSLINIYDNRVESKLIAMDRLVSHFILLNKFDVPDNYINQLEFYTTSESPDIQLKAYNILVYFYYSQNLYVKQWQAAHRGETIANNIGDKTMVLYFQDYRKRIFSRFSAHKIYLDLVLNQHHQVLESGNDELIIGSYYNIMDAYFNLRMEDELRDVVNEFRKLFGHNTSLLYTGYVNCLIGESYLRQYCYDEAKEEFSEGIAISKEREEFYELALNYNGLSMLYYAQDDIQNSLNYLDSAKKYVVNSQSENHFIKHEINLYRSMGEDSLLLDAYERSFQLQTEKGNLLSQEGDLLSAIINEYSDQNIELEKSYQKKIRNGIVAICGILMVILIIRIIMYRHKAIRKIKTLKANKEQLEVLSKEFEILNVFLLHDLNSSILSLKHLTSEDMNGSSSYQSNNEILQDILDSMLNLTKSVFDFRTSQPILSPVQFTEMIQSISGRDGLKNVERPLKSRIELSQEYKYKTAFYINVIIRNTIDNIVKHTSAQDIHLTLTDSPESLYIYVSYDGSPMSDDIIQIYRGQRMTHARRKGITLIRTCLDKLSSSIDITYSQRMNHIHISIPLGHT